MRISAAALGKKPANFAPDPDALSRVSGQAQRDCRKRAREPSRMPPHGALNPALGGPRATADGARTATTSSARWATLMPVNFAARRRGYAGQCRRKQSHAAGVFGFTRTALVLHTSTVFSHLISIGQ
jgi:hypothetical protein